MFHFTIKEMYCLGSWENTEKMTLSPLSFAIHFSFWSVPKTEFTRLEFYTIVLSSALFSTRPSPPFSPIGSLAPNQTTLKCPGPSSKAPTFPRDFPTFPDFPKSQLCKECVTPGGALTASIVLAPPPRLLKFIWSMLLFACFLTWGLRVLQCHFSPYCKSRDSCLWNKFQIVGLEVNFAVGPSSILPDISPINFFFSFIHSLADESINTLHLLLLCFIFKDKLIPSTLS